jgi:hypothetical protein
MMPRSLSLAAATMAAFLLLPPLLPHGAARAAQGGETAAARRETFHDNGMPAVQEETVGNRRIERRFSPDGVKRGETQWLLDERGATKLREQAFSETGMPVSDQRWNAAGELLSNERFYPNGQPRRRTLYGVDGNPRLIEITEFHDNGQQAAAGRYLMDAERFNQRTPIGAHRRFNDKGIPLAESVYDDQGRLTRERAWDDNGRLKRDEQALTAR